MSEHDKNGVRAARVMAQQTREGHLGRGRIALREQRDEKSQQSTICAQYGSLGVG